MQQYPRKAPARSLTYGKKVVFKLWLAALVVISMTAFTQATHAQTGHTLVMKFDQSSLNAYKGDVWLQVEDPFSDSNAPSYQPAFALKATYNGTPGTPISFKETPESDKTLLMSVPVKLSTIGAGGLTITYSNSSHLYFFYDDPTKNARTSAPSVTSPNWPQRFQDVELTMIGGEGDYGNLTYINWFTAPLSITSYGVPIGTTQTPTQLQYAGWGSHTAVEIAKEMAKASGGKAKATWKVGGNILRYLGPGNFDPSNPQFAENPWPSFIPYTKSLNQAGKGTIIYNQNGFNFGGTENLPAYQIGPDMWAVANADGSLDIIGSITVSGNAPIRRNNPNNPLPPNYVADGNNWSGYWDGAKISIAVKDAAEKSLEAEFDYTIYGQTRAGVSPAKVLSFTGDAWVLFEQFCKDTKNSTGTSLNDLGAYNTTLNFIIGEITTGLVGGFFNSDYPFKPGVTPLKNMSSNEWWAQNPMVGFAQIQPTHSAPPYYNNYASIIFNLTNNTAYGVPYSDRFNHAGNSPAVMSVLYDNKKGTKYNVTSWTIGIGAPLPKSGLTGMLELLLLK